MTEHRTYYRRHLPHYQPHEAIIFLTYRLANSLPPAVVLEIQQEKDRLFAAAARQVIPELKEAELARANKILFARYDDALAVSGKEKHDLALPEVAQAVVTSILRAAECLFTLEAYCVMPNHVHVVVTPNQVRGEVVPLAKITQALKGASALEANRLLGRSGQFWQRESFDHVVRDVEELERVVRYVLWNPVKAGLVADWRPWPWSYARLLPAGF